MRKDAGFVHTGSFVEDGKWNVECEMWDVKCEMWDVKRVRWDVKCVRWDVRGKEKRGYRAIRKLSYWVNR